MTASKKNPPLTEAFTSYLRDRGMRLTSERMTISEAISRHSDIFTVEELYNELASGNIHVSLATVYNTMGLLCDASLVCAVSTPDIPNVMYKLAGNSTVKVFRICEKCGQVRESTDRRLASMLAGHTFRGFSTKRICISVYGLCTRCSRLAKKK